MNDLISRQAAIDAAKEELDNETFYDIPSKIKYLPSVQPERKKGGWLSYELGERDTYYCSECGDATKIPHYVGGFLYNFCPWCGADMRGGEDATD